jgi:hypothetical protein
MVADVTNAMVAIEGETMRQVTLGFQRGDQKRQLLQSAASHCRQLTSRRCWTADQTLTPIA